MGVKTIKKSSESVTGNDGGDSVIIAKVINGDNQAFAELVRKYQPKVQSTCSYILLDKTRGEDAAQEVFIKIFRSLKSFRYESSFSTFVYRLTVNHCRDLLRKMKRTRAESLDQLLEERSGVVDQVSVYEPRSEGDPQLLERLLSSLKPDYREIIVLREIRELSYQEIAEALHCSVDSVKAKLKRARQMLVNNARHLDALVNVNKSGKAESSD